MDATFRTKENLSRGLCIGKCSLYREVHTVHRIPFSGFLILMTACGYGSILRARVRIHCIYMYEYTPEIGSLSMYPPDRCCIIACSLVPMSRTSTLKVLWVKLTSCPRDPNLCSQVILVPLLLRDSVGPSLGLSKSYTGI